MACSPAKEVGGDFYDFFLLDDDHLGLVISDVSGKDIPAALFMMAAKNLIKTHAMIGGKPSEVLQRVNNEVCKTNANDMFVTAWLGILTISSGKIIVANAGHEYPVLRHQNGNFELFKDKHGLVIGGMEGMRYRDYELTLEEGDTLFVYTDGVPEATNGELSMFGTDRMLQALNSKPDVAPQELLENVSKYIAAFVGEAEAKVGLSVKGELLTLTIEYNGRAYDPTAKEDPDVTLGAEDRKIGGLGIFMVKKFAQDDDYKRVGDRNILKITLKLS